MQKWMFNLDFEHEDIVTDPMTKFRLLLQREKIRDKFNKRKAMVLGWLIVALMIFFPSIITALTPANVSNEEEFGNVSFMALDNGKSSFNSEGIKLDTLLADWKTYTNREYGYSIKYPNALICYDKDKKHVKFGSKVMPYISVDIYDNFDGLDLKQFASQLLEQEFSALLDTDSIIWKTVNVGGRDGLKVIFENVAGGYTGKVNWYCLQKNTKIYRLAILQEIDKSLELNNKIIKTFELIANDL